MVEANTREENLAGPEMQGSPLAADTTETVQVAEVSSESGDNLDRYRFLFEKREFPPGWPANERLADMQLALPGKTIAESIEVGGDQRHYLLHLSSQFKSGEARPLVLVFHGFGGGTGQGGTPAGALGMPAVTGLNEIADRENFTVVYLNGNEEQSNSWNNGQWFFSKRDDVAFVTRVLNRLMPQLNVDPSRVYLAGFSQGASFTHRVAQHVGDRIAAIADVSGWMTGNEKPTDQPFSVLSIQSANDPVVKADGKQMGPFMSMKPEQYTSEFYRRARGIDEQPVTEVVPGLHGDVISQRQTNQRTGAEVVSILVQDRAHVWFGGKGLEESSSINASQIVWDFFNRHRRTDK